MKTTNSNEGMSLTGIIRLVYTAMFGYLVLALTMLFLFGCGQQAPQTSTPSSTDVATGGSSSLGNSSTDKSVSVIPASIQTDNGEFARLVQSITDLPCTDKNGDQLIYVKTTKSFYYCDGVALEWTAIDIQAPVGKDGVNGKDGANGVAGINGKDGVAGKDGADGIAGQDGVAGKDGSNGANGVDGAAGVAGTNGTNGTNGSNAQAVTLIAKYSLSPTPASSTISGAYTANYLEADLFSDGSIRFSGEVINSSTVYSPSFFIGASEKANPKLTSLTNFILGGKTLAFRTTAGSDALTGYNSFGANSTFTVGIQIPNTGASVDINSMTYFTLSYENGQ